MTEERFFITGYGDVVDREDRAIYLSIETMVKTMNDQDIEIKLIKQTIQEAYNNERTTIGKSVLKQLLESIGE